MERVENPESNVLVEREDGCPLSDGENKENSLNESLLSVDKTQIESGKKTPSFNEKDFRENEVSPYGPNYSRNGDIEVLQAGIFSISPKAEPDQYPIVAMGLDAMQSDMDSSHHQHTTAILQEMMAQVERDYEGPVAHEEFIRFEKEPRPDDSYDRVSDDSGLIKGLEPLDDSKVLLPDDPKHDFELIENSSKQSPNKALIEFSDEMNGPAEPIANDSAIPTKPEPKPMTTSMFIVDEPVPEIHFHVKEIRFLTESPRIALQSKNGPCPLLAVVNALALKGHLKIPAGRTVSLERLMNLVAEALLALSPKYDEQLEGERERGIDDVLRLLSGLCKGLVVGLGFKNITDFELTSALKLFSLVDVRLVHGWLPDPQLTELCELLEPRSYVDAAIKALEASNHGLIIKEFLDSTKSQLTYYGLERLNHELQDNEVAVLFRNNHFSTMYKRRDELFLLCTDEAFGTDNQVVWETLSNVDGDCYFVDWDFRTYSSAPSDYVPVSDEHHITDQPGSSGQMDSDERLARALQEEEHRASRERSSAHRTQESQTRQKPTKSETPRQKPKSSCALM